MAVVRRGLKVHGIDALRVGGCVYHADDRHGNTMLARHHDLAKSVLNLNRA